MDPGPGRRLHRVALSQPLPRLSARRRPPSRPRTRAGCPRRRLTGSRFPGASSSRQPRAHAPRHSSGARSAAGGVTAPRPGCSRTAPSHAGGARSPAPGPAGPETLAVTKGGTRGRRRPGRLSQGARVARRTARRPWSPDSSAAATRPVQLRPAPGYEVDVRLSVTTSLQVFLPRSDIPRNHVHSVRLSSPRCLPQPPSPHSCSLRGSWGRSGMGRSPPPRLSPAAPRQQDSFSSTPSASPGTGSRWALGVGGHGCVPAAVASRPGGSRG